MRLVKAIKAKWHWSKTRIWLEKVNAQKTYRFLRNIFRYGYSDSLAIANIEYNHGGAASLCPGCIHVIRVAKMSNIVGRFVDLACECGRTSNWNLYGGKKSNKVDVDIVISEIMKTLPPVHVTAENK